MAMGGGPLDKDDYQVPMAEINTTPLVDVMLVLLVIFLVTAPMLTQAVKLELPNEKATEIADKNPIILSVDKEGNYFWDKEPLSPEALEERLQEAARENTKQPIHLRADKEAAYGKVSFLLVAAQKVGLNTIGFITEPK